VEEDLEASEADEYAKQHVKIKEKIATESFSAESTHYHGRFKERSQHPYNPIGRTEHFTLFERPWPRF